MKVLSILFVLYVAGAEAQNAGTSTACGTAAGTRFNLEARELPQPQNQTAVDFLPGSGGDLVVGVADDMRQLSTGFGVPPDFRGLFGLTSQTGFYVHRNSADTNPCSPDLEGGLAPLVNPSDNLMMVGVGFAAVVADPARQAFFIADSRVANGEAPDSAVGLFRTTATNLNNPGICPSGTLTQAQAAVCWPSTALVNTSTNFERTNSSPHLAVDERTTGVGAGDVYITATQVGVNGGMIVVTACKNDLSACSPALRISGSDTTADLSHVALRPDGGITVTYANSSGGQIGVPATADIKFVLCQPRGAPQSPSCAAAVTVQSETQAIPYDPFNPETGLGAAQFVLRTYPKHANRQDTNGIETYIVWERCKVSTAVAYPGLTFVNICPDADLVMAASADDGKTWQFADVDAGNQDQFQAWITTDPSNQIVNIVYYSSQADTFQHRPQVMLRQILPGPATPDMVSEATAVTSTPMEPNTDAVLQGIFIGDYPGIAARGGRAYIHHTHTIVNGTYNGEPSPEQNNHLSRFDY